MLTKEDLKQIQTLLSDIATKNDLQVIGGDIKTIKSDIINIRKDTKTVINFFDKVISI